MRTGWKEWVPPLAIAAALLATGWHGWQRFAHNVANPPALAATAGEALPIRQAGDSVPAVDVVRIVPAGSDASISLRGLSEQSECSVIYAFDPQCPACVEGAPKWAPRQTIEGGGPPAAVIWLAFHQDRLLVDEFAATHAIQAPVFALLDRSQWATVGVSSVPTMWGVHNGRIAHIAIGASTSPDSVAVSMRAWCG